MSRLPPGLVPVWAVALGTELRVFAEPVVATPQAVAELSFLCHFQSLSSSSRITIPMTFDLLDMKSSTSI